MRRCVNELLLLPVILPTQLGSRLGLLTIGGCLRSCLRAGYFFDALLSGFEDGLAMLYQGHSPFVLLEAVGQGDFTLFDFADNVRKLFYCLLEAQFTYIVLVSALSHYFTFSDCVYSYLIFCFCQQAPQLYAIAHELETLRYFSGRRVLRV